MLSARVCLYLALGATAFAQDSLRVVSPDGQIEVHFGVVLPPRPGAFLRLAYQVSVQGKPLLKQSYMGFLIHNQEPLLGENLGLSESKASKGDGYNEILGQFLQNGSLGRRIDIEMRVYNDGIAFRYTIPRTSPLEDLLIEAEETEFHFAQDGAVELRGGRRTVLSKLGPDDVPVAVEQAGIGWVSVGDVASANYPSMTLSAEGGSVLMTVLAARPEGWPVETKSPLTTAWRVLLIGAEPKAITGLPK